MELNYKNLASAYLEVLESYDFVIPEDVPANERTAFHGAAAAAHKDGKSHFDFGGKKYPVTMKKAAAKAINSEVQKEAKEDAEPEASTEVDGNDENDTEAKKVPCPKCEGKGCAHCDDKGYHMSKVESSCGSDGKKSRKESVELDESDSYYAMQAAKAHAKRDGKNYDRDVSVQHRYDAYHMKKRGYTHFTPGRYGTRTYHKTNTSGATEIDSSHYHGVRESVNEISRTMTPMRNKFGGTVDPKKFDKYKKHMKTHKLDEPTVRMIHQDPDHAESKRMMKNPKYAQAVGLYKDSMKKESVDEKKLTPKEIKRALASIKPPKKKPTLPKAPFEIPKENTFPSPMGSKHTTIPNPIGGKKRVRSTDKRPVNVNVDGKQITRMEPVTKRTAAAFESVNRKNWLDALQNKKLQEAEDAKTKTSKPTGLHHSDDATRDTYDKQLSTRKGEQDFVKMHDVETPEYADVERVLPKTFAAFTAGVKAGGGKTNDAPGDKGPVKSGN